MSVIILLTDRHAIGAEMFVVGRDGKPTRNREDARRFTRDEAEAFRELHDEPPRPSDSPFLPYRMFIDPTQTAGGLPDHEERR